MGLRRHRRGWTALEDARLLERRIPDRELAAELGRTLVAVRKRRRAIGAAGERFQRPSGEPLEAREVATGPSYLAAGRGLSRRLRGTKLNRGRLG